MSEEVINQTTLDELKKMVGDDFIGELVETFFEDSPELLAEMRAALDSGDAEAFRRSAHSMKSNSASFGAVRLSSLARELEFMGRDGQLDEARVKLPDLEAAYAEATSALKKMI